MSKCYFVYGSGAEEQALAADHTLRISNRPRPCLTGFFPLAFSCCFCSSSSQARSLCLTCYFETIISGMTQGREGEKESKGLGRRTDRQKHRRPQGKMVVWWFFRRERQQAAAGKMMQVEMR